MPLSSIYLSQYLFSKYIRVNAANKNSPVKRRMKDTLFLFGLIFNIISITISAEYCYRTDDFALHQRAGQYGTKTAYVNAKGQGNKNNFTVEGYQPEKVWFLSRHGTRYPGPNISKELKELEKV